jgi:DNA-binding NtrC family response regulator
MADDNRYLEVGRDLRDLAEILLDANFTADEAWQHFQRAYLEKALERAGGNMCRAAQLVKLHRNTFARHVPFEAANQVRERVRQHRAKMRGRKPIASVREVTAQRRAA